MIEAELKARVDHPETVRAALAAIAEPEHATYRDTYFDRPDHRLDTAGTEIRLRTIETTGSIRHMLTYKQPAVDATGSKPEHETDVTDPAPVAAMLTGLGLVTLVSLTKTCANYRFNWDGRSILATLVTVPELDGTFLEVQTMAEAGDLAAASATVRTVLADLGLADALESGTYTDAVRAARGPGQT
jgi:adenylate cyclase, class 2